MKTTIEQVTAHILHFNLLQLLTFVSDRCSFQYHYVDIQFSNDFTAVDEQNDLVLRASMCILNVKCARLRIDSIHVK